MRTSKYTREHVEFLREHYQHMNARQLTEAFNEHFGLDRTHDSIKSALPRHGIRANRNKIMPLREFTREQVEWIREAYTSMSVSMIVTAFNARFDENKSFSQIRGLLRNRKIQSGRTGHFPKGVKPWNTGTKGIMKPNSGTFGKGHVPATIQPIGHERICAKDGYVYIKVEETDPNTGAPTRFKPKHVHIYEQEHGPVPDGMAVIFKDADKRNFDPDNLAAVTRAELLAMNIMGYKNFPDDIKPSVLAVSKLKAKTWERKKEASQCGKYI